jgi:uncharacterized membrane protein YccC
MKNSHVISVTLKSIFLVVGSYLCGYYFTHLIHEPTSLVGGLWAAISGIIVFENTAPDTLHSAKIRIIGSLTGAIVSGIYLFFFPFTILGFSICIGCGVLFCYLLKIQHSIKLTAITISVILIVSTVEKELHPILNAGLRFIESAIGTGLALLVAYGAYYLNKTKT